MRERDEYELIGGMLAAEAPQEAAARVIAMLERGESERVRDLIEARAARTAAAIAAELALID